MHVACRMCEKGCFSPCVVELHFGIVFGWWTLEFWAPNAHAEWNWCSSARNVTKWKKLKHTEHEQKTALKSCFHSHTHTHTRADNSSINFTFEWILFRIRHFLRSVRETESHSWLPKIPKATFNFNNLFTECCTIFVPSCGAGICEHVYTSGTTIISHLVWKHKSAGLKFSTNFYITIEVEHSAVHSRCRTKQRKYSLAPSSCILHFFLSFSFLSSSFEFLSCIKKNFHIRFIFFAALIFTSLYSCGVLYVCECAIRCTKPLFTLYTREQSFMKNYYV